MTRYSAVLPIGTFRSSDDSEGYWTTFINGTGGFWIKADGADSGVWIFDN